MICFPLSCRFTTFCSFVDDNLLFASALVRSRWIASITSGCCARTALPSFVIQSSFELIMPRTSGVATSALTESSQDCLSTAAFSSSALSFGVVFDKAVCLNDLQRIGRRHENAATANYPDTTRSARRLHRALRS